MEHKMSIEERRKIWRHNLQTVAQDRGSDGPEFILKQWCESLTEDEREVFVEEIKKIPSVIGMLKPMMDLCKRLSKE